MAEQVVDGLGRIEVEIEDGRLRVLALRHLDRLSETRVEESGSKAGQHVMLGQMLDHLLGALALRQVAHRQDIAAAAAIDHPPRHQFTRQFGLAMGGQQRFVMRAGCQPARRQQQEVRFAAAQFAELPAGHLQKALVGVEDRSLWCRWCYRGE